MLLRRLYHDRLAQAAYLVACQETKEAIVIDPLRDPAPYLEAARQDGVTITTVLRNGHAIIDVHDDGLGMSEDRLEHALDGGIGLSNVNERLRTIYGEQYQLKLRSVPGQGTSASLEIPELAVSERVTA